jgi:hypothetical protein
MFYTRFFYDICHVSLIEITLATDERAPLIKKTFNFKHHQP